MQSDMLMKSCYGLKCLTENTRYKHHSQNLQCFLMKTLSLRKHCNSWPRSLKSTFVRQVFMLINLSLVVRKPAYCICENEDADQLRSHCASCAVNAQLISAVVFATQIVQSLCFLYTKFQASSHLLWLYSMVFVVPSRNPLRPVFSQRGSFRNFTAVFFCFYSMFYSLSNNY